ncbi:LLM class flavin-dependent oxidoreductase [Streptomyces sp. NPDC086783]|uniref:LLM class flavin-dependent oxidoreductase n=1 Tax=Streptomyces sp. NPDC086783 TaxID=3365758 RepID=UPI0038130D61
MKFGCFVYFQERDMPTAQMYREYLDEICYTDRLGFDEVWLAEHHFTDYATTPSPNLLLSNIATRTERIRIGSMVNPLPLYDPLRFAEEIAVLDQLSQGRVNIGIGSGVPSEMQRFGRSAEQAKPRFREALDVIVRALSQDRFNHHGDFYHYSDATVTPRPVQLPHPPIFQGVLSPQSVVTCAEQGIPITRIYDTFDQARSMTQLYRATVAAQHPHGLTSSLFRPSVRHVRPIYVANTTEQAFHEAVPELFRHFRRFADVTDAEHTTPSPDNWRHLVEKAPIPLGPHDFEQMDAENIVIIGDPDRVRNKLLHLREHAGMDGFIGIFAFGNLPHEHVCRSLHLFAETVMPSLPKDADTLRHNAPDLAH